MQASQNSNQEPFPSRMRITAMSMKPGLGAPPIPRWAVLIKTLPLLLLALGFLSVALWRGEPSKAPDRSTPLWKPSLEQAEISRKKGDLYGAANFYAYAAQAASAEDDWEGLLAVACGLQKMGDSLGPPLSSHTILSRAMAAAQRKQSTEGLQAVAIAFKMSGEWFAAMAISRIQQGSLNREQMAGYLKHETCWPAVGKN